MERPVCDGRVGSLTRFAGSIHRLGSVHRLGSPIPPVTAGVTGSGESGATALLGPVRVGDGVENTVLPGRPVGEVDRSPSHDESSRPAGIRGQRRSRAWHVRHVDRTTAVVRIRQWVTEPPRRPVGAVVGGPDARYGLRPGRHRRGSRSPPSRHTIGVLRIC